MESITVTAKNRNEGKENIELYVLEVPEECDTCPFYMQNVNKDKIMNHEEVHYCVLKGALVSAQYGGIDVQGPLEWKCPLLSICDSGPYINHEERISTVERILGITPRPYKRGGHGGH